MFNLDESIREWRLQMEARHVAATEALNELESHLREDIQHQLGSGLPEQKAFEAAVKNLGEADQLKREFNKAGSTDEVKQHRLLGALMGLFAAIYASVSGYGVLTHEMTLGERTLGMGAIVLTVLLLFGIPALYQFLPVLPRKRNRLSVQVACVLPMIIWLMISCKWLLLRYDFDPSQLVVAILWTIVPLGAVGGLSYGLDEAYYRKAFEPKSTQD